MLLSPPLKRSHHPPCTCTWAPTHYKKRSNTFTWSRTVYWPLYFLNLFNLSPSYSLFAVWKVFALKYIISDSSSCFYGTCFCLILFWDMSVMQKVRRRPSLCINILYTRIVCVRGGVWGSVPQTDKHLRQNPFICQFFRWRHFALPSMSLIFQRCIERDPQYKTVVQYNTYPKENSPDYMIKQRNYQ
jgi:hypothetical protein